LLIALLATAAVDKPAKAGAIKSKGKKPPFCLYVFLGIKYPEFPVLVCGRVNAIALYLICVLLIEKIIR
jgi:hypothetical protein